MKTVLVIREFDEFSRILTEKDFKVVNLPLIETKPVDDLSEFESKLANIKIYDGVFLTSAKAAEIFRAKLTEGNISYRGKVYILGRRSFEILRDENLDVVFDETANSAREVLESISSDELKNKRFLFIRGEKSLRIVPEFLAEMATVDEVIVYRTDKTVVELIEIKKLKEQFENREVGFTCFFSPSGAESFLEQFGGEILHQTKIAAIGKTTADYFERQNFKVDFVSPKSSAKDFAVELIEYLEKNLPDS